MSGGSTVSGVLSAMHSGQGAKLLDGTTQCSLGMSPPSALSPLSFCSFVRAFGEASNAASEAPLGAAL